MSDAEKLRRAYRLLDHVHDLSLGQIVTWKPGLKNRDQPGLSEPLVVAPTTTPRAIVAASQ